MLITAAPLSTARSIPSPDALQLIVPPFGRV